MNRLLPLAVLALLPVLTQACVDEPFVVEEFQQAGARDRRLNEELIFELSRDVERRSAESPAVRIRRLPEGPEARGEWKVDAGTLRFVPTMPCRPDLSDSGLLPGSHYAVEFQGPPWSRCLRSSRGRLLEEGFRAEFWTVDAPLQDLMASYIGPPPGSELELAADQDGMILRDGAVELQFSAPLDPAALARAVFRLRGPWDPGSGSSPEKWDRTVPPLSAALVFNGTPSRLRLRLPEVLSSELLPESGPYWIDVVDPGFVRDFGGNELADEVVGVNNPLLRIRFPGGEAEEASE